MNVTYSDRAKWPVDNYTLLQQATTRLEEVLGQSAGLVKVEWDHREDGQGQPVYTLRLSDWTGTVSADFTHGELQSPSRTRVLLYRLWGKLLQIRSHKQLEELSKSGD